MIREAKRSARNQSFDWVRINSAEALFRSVETFTITDTIVWVLPTQSPWSVVWNNSALCVVDDNVAYRLAHLQHLEALSFKSTNRDAIHVAGTRFTHHWPGPDCNGPPRCRNVYCCNQGSRWHFEQSGEPLAEEDLERYTARRKRDRLNEEGTMALLDRLGARPWREDWYDFAQNRCLQVIEEPNHPIALRQTFEQVRARATGKTLSEMQEGQTEQEVRRPPDYLRGHAFTPRDDGPARLLADGAWCGHGESEFKVFEIRCGENDCFRVQLPLPEGELSHNPPLVRLTCTATSERVIAYDSRRHPGSVYIGSTVEPHLQPPLACTHCGEKAFRAAAGFAIHPESSDANDTSWFALAVACVACGHSEIVCEDEC